ncbi:MAG: hypothetical protein ABJE95_01515 [Byssovorax sp.]
MEIVPAFTGIHSPLGIESGITVKELAEGIAPTASHVPSHASGALNC